MSIISEHGYREGYLKSEQWKTVRIEALKRVDATCDICGVRSIHNDAHHIFYPKNIYLTTADDLVVLCRHCHDLVHQVMDSEQIKRCQKLYAYRRSRNILLAKIERVDEYDVDIRSNDKRCALCRRLSSTTLKRPLFGNSFMSNYCDECFGLAVQEIAASKTKQQAVRIARDLFTRKKNLTG